MAVVDRIFGIVIMAFILLFSIIHLGVSIGYIVPYRKYGDIFRPIIGLSGYNLVICILGFVTGALGLVAINMRSEKFARVVCFLSAILGIFALASLIAALVANSKSFNYVSTRFSNDLMAYKTKVDSQDRINDLQLKYKCCGTDMWIDWKRAKLNANEQLAHTTTTTTTSPTTTTTSNINTTTANIDTTTTANIETTTTTANIDTTTTIANIDTTTTTLIPGSSEIPVNKNVKRDVGHISNSLDAERAPYLAGPSRVKRQVTSNYGGIPDLPVSFEVVMPVSCCISAGGITNTSGSFYCLSTNGTNPNEFYINGCARSIGTTAGNQFMGFVVINSFMIILAFVSIPILLGSPTDFV